MKKVIIPVLAACFSLGLSGIAMAETPLMVEEVPMPEPAIEAEDNIMAEELAAITLLVKEKLAIGDQYDQFYGDSRMEGLSTSWDLNWSNDYQQITVEVDDTGFVHYYSYDNYQQDYNYHQFAPRFAEHEFAAAYAAAQQFIKIAAFENYSLAPADDIIWYSTEEDYRFYGSVYINGLPSSLYFSITVNGSDLSIAHYRCDYFGQSHIGEIPSNQATHAAHTAANSLSEYLEMDLAYHLPEDGTEARLEYHPAYMGEYYVDALNGKILDMAKLYQEADQAMGDRGFYGYGTEDAMAAEAEATMANDADSGGASLTDVEGEFIDQVADLLTADVLDQKLRALNALGLGEQYTLGRADYALIDEEAGLYHATLEYYRQADAASLGITEAELKQITDEYGIIVFSKIVTVDAKDGSLQNLYSYMPAYMANDLSKEPTKDFQGQIAEYLTELNGAYFEQTALEEYENYQSLNYATYMRQANGYDFAANFLVAEVNPYTGELLYYTYQWDEDITFASAENIISETEALAIYRNSVETVLQYQSIPLAIDPLTSDYPEFFEYGYGYLYQMQLVYGFLDKDGEALIAIDALTGEGEYSNWDNYSSIEYSDLADYAHRAEIEKLADYGIGYYKTQLNPTAALTEAAMLELLLSTADYSFDIEQELDFAYQLAYQLGFLAAGQQDLDRVITKGEFISALIKASPYGVAAPLPGIYQLGFSDAAAIDPALSGYAALAQGLGLVDAAAPLAADQAINRGDAAMIIYHFMDRDY